MRSIRDHVRAYGEYCGTVVQAVVANYLDAFHCWVLQMWENFHQYDAMLLCRCIHLSHLISFHRERALAQDMFLMPERLETRWQGHTVGKDTRW